MKCEGRWRGLYRIISSKTISPGYEMRRPLARVRAEYVCKDHQPLATECEGRWRDERGALAARLGKLRAAYATVTRQPQRRSIVTGAARTRRAASGVSW